MKLGIELQDFTKIIRALPSSDGRDGIINAVVYDTRKIGESQHAVFFALPGSNSDGHNFVQNAYEKGIRFFVVSQEIELKKYADATFFKVENTLDSLLLLACYQRSNFLGKVVAISGKYGKTSVKEYAHHFLTPEYKVFRSPKSYNSELGIALSLLEINLNADIALIEIKAHDQLDPVRMNQVVKPTLAVFCTSEGMNVHSNEYYERLFSGSKELIYIDEIRKLTISNCKYELVKRLNASLFEKNVSNFKIANASIAYTLAKVLGIDGRELNDKLNRLPYLALRMETFEGLHDNFIINDAYNLDFDSLRSSLEFQQSISKGKKRAVIIGLSENKTFARQEIEQLLEEFNLDSVQIVSNENEVDLNFENTVVLIQSTGSKELNRIANRLKIKRHQTELQIDVKALRKNILAHKELLPKETKIMAMLKASGYGSGLNNIAQFINGLGVEYFGVAYVEEGVELRNSGISKPIMVMNTEKDNFETCINNQLQPAIFDFQQLDDFIAECIFQGVENYPIHLKIETGMNRLGFTIANVPKVLEIIKSQPEIKIQSVYSHLAEADNRRDRRFTEHQIQLFSSAIKKINEEVHYDFESHILNSSGIANYPNAAFSMVRLGIGMFGISSNPELKRKLLPVLAWKSAVSLLKKIPAGQSVGYGRSFISKDVMMLATIPVGYADGFRRSLGNGVGSVFIHGRKCPTVGRICMDMIMVDVSKINVNVGDDVEIIGTNQSIEKLAELMQTIPYEVMTSISERVHKIYIE